MRDLLRGLWRDHAILVVLMVMTSVFGVVEGGSAGLTLIATVAVGLPFGVLLRRWLPEVRPTPWPDHPYRQRRAPWPPTAASQRHDGEPARRPTLRQFCGMLVVAVPVGVAEWWLIDAARWDVILPFLYGLNLAAFVLVRALWRLIGERRAETSLPSPMTGSATASDSSSHR